MNGSVLLKGIPYYCSLPLKESLPPSAAYEYLVKCTLKPSHGKRVILKPSPNTPWQPLDATHLTEYRYQGKLAIKRWISTHYSSLPVVQFLSGLITGDFDDTQLKNDFARFGLLHLLAISGFHFSIFSAFLCTLLKPCIPSRILYPLLIALLSLYFLFLGWGPSVVRAWMTIILFYNACWRERISSPINSLGCVMICSVVLDPLLIESLGFQFSILQQSLFCYSMFPPIRNLSGSYPEEPFKRSSLGLY